MAHKLSKSKCPKPIRNRRPRKPKRRFGQSQYQADVNNLTGAMGPTTVSEWRSYDSTTGNPFSLAAQPLYYDGHLGMYVTASAGDAAGQSISFGPTGTANFSTAFGRRRKSRKSRKSRKARKSQSFNDRIY